MPEPGKSSRKKKAETQISNRKAKYLKETRNSDGTIKIPDEVVDKKAYLDYIKMHDKVEADPDLYHQTSDPDLIVNVLSRGYVLDNLISHLPHDEIAVIKGIASRIRGVQATAATFKKKAYGANYFKRGSVNNDIDARLQNKRFFDERGSELIEYFGRFFTLHEVHRTINEEWGYTISLKSLGQWRVDNIDSINARQEEFKTDYAPVRLGYKRSRLDELNYLYQTRKDIYKKSLKLEDGKEMRGTLDQIRKEVEADTLTINGKLSIDHELRIQQQVNTELMKGINIKALVLSRVAAKLQINPVVLQYQLINSYYAKFTGFQRADDNILTDEIVYPSAHIYDFDDLGVKNRQIEAEDAKIIEEMVQAKPDVEEKEAIDDIRTRVMKKLIEAKAMNSKTKETINVKRMDNPEK